MVIDQGDVFWVDLDDPSGSEPGYRHPHVVIQNNVFNHSRINTVVVCPLTSNLTRAKAPGNVLLEVGEGGLPHQGVVVVSQLVTYEKASLGEYIGRLSPPRLEQVLEGVRLAIEPRELSNNA